LGIRVTLESIIRRTFLQADRTEVQERIARQVELDPEPYFARYLADPRSLGGRYVNSDLMKEMFDDYNQSKEARRRYNSPLHNTAAVLASEQYRRIISDDLAPYRDIAIFLTGIPGAGKTTYVLKGGDLADDVRVLYEGQLANPNQAIPKIEQAINAGLRAYITVVHLPADQALQNTIYRFEAEGRGASIEAMASIQGRLPDGLRAIHECFRNNVDLTIVDRRGTIPIRLRGWQYLSELESEGNYEDIKKRLTNFIEREFRAGLISESAYDQAIGRVPKELPGRLGEESTGRPGRSDQTLPKSLVEPAHSKDSPEYPHKKRRPRRSCIDRER
jgi:hypothetical protein